MMLFDIFNRIQKIDHLIKIKGTGNAAELANKLGLSRTRTYEYIDLMKQLGAPIKYDSVRRSFFYEEDGGFPIRFQSNKSKADYERNDSKEIITTVFLVTNLLYLYV